MAGIKDLDAVAANNNSAPPDGAPEGMDAAAVNNIQRQQMANMKNDVLYRVPLLTNLKALDSTKQITGNGITLSGLTVVGESGGVFYYDSTSSATSDDVNIVTPTDAIGRWIRSDGSFFGTVIQTQDFTTVYPGPTTGFNQLVGYIAANKYTGAAQNDTFTGYRFETDANGTAGPAKAGIFLLQPDSTSTAGKVNLDVRTSSSAVTMVSFDGETEVTTYPGPVSKNGTHPAFEVQNSANDADVTGDGTVVTVDFNQENKDQGGNFSGDTFTAPIGGQYMFSCSIDFDDIVAAHTTYDLLLVTSNRSFRLSRGNPGTMADAGGRMSVGGSFECRLDAFDTAFITFSVSGSTKVIDIRGTGSTGLTIFSGSLSA